MPRRIKKAKIDFISLVPLGANRMPVIYKDDGAVEIDTISRMDEKGELLAVVYAPEVRDTQGDIASAEVIKEMAYDFIANGAKIDIRHDGKAVGKTRARIAESFIVVKSDSRFQDWKTRDGRDVDLTGAWATVIKIDDPELRRLYREGTWNGVSMGGTAVVEAEKSDDQLDRFAELMMAKLGISNTKQEKKMDEKTIAEVVAKSVGEAFKPLNEALTKILEKAAPAPAPEKKSAVAAPVFKGSFDDEKALSKFQRELELWQLQKDADLSNAEGVKTFRDAVAALKASWAEADKSVETKKTNQVEGDVESASVQGLKKEDQQLLEEGRKLFAKK